MRRGMLGSDRAARSARAADREASDRTVNAVIAEVEKTCRDQTIYMIGPEHVTC